MPIVERTLRVVLRSVELEMRVLFTSPLAARGVSGFMCSM